MNKSDYDVIIVGGAIVGATLACALANTRLRVAVIEAKPPALDWPEDSVDLRVSALTLSSLRILAALEVWPDIAARISPFREMHVWDSMGSGLIHFDSADIGEATLGYIVENRVIQSALFKRARTCANIDWLSGTDVSALDLLPEQAILCSADGRELSASLVVGADGSNSAVRRLAGITTRGWDHRQTAVVTVVNISGCHQATAWQRFLPTGPLAFLPLANGACSIVWSTTPEHAEHLCTIDESEFIAELQTALGTATEQTKARVSLGEVTGIGARAAFPLRLIHANHYVRPRLALMGDAAHTVHPLAGQGVNLGLSDAAALAEVLLDALGDCGALRTLRRYERWRKGDNLAVIMALEGIRQIFSQRSPPPLRWLRNTGLNLTNALSPVKNALMYRAMGLKGDLPKLARGVKLNYGKFYAQR